MNEEFKPGEYWEERLSKNPDISGVGITIFGKGFNRWSYRSRANSFRRALLSLNLSQDKGSLSVGDIGSGTGFYINEWEKFGIRKITGFDITSVSVSLLSKKYPNYQFIHQDISQTIPEELKNKFDVISCMDVFFHIVDSDNYQMAFKNIATMLKPGGILIFSENWIPKEKQFNGHWFVMKTPEEGDQVLNNSGLKMIQRAPFMQLMDAPRNTENKIIQFYWKVLIYILRRIPALGSLFGCLIFPFELAFKRFSSSAFGVEIFTVQKN